MKDVNDMEWPEAIFVLTLVAIAIIIVGACLLVGMLWAIALLIDVTGLANYVVQILQDSGLLWTSSE